MRQFIKRYYVFTALFFGAPAAFVLLGALLFSQAGFAQSGRSVQIDEVRYYFYGGRKNSPNERLFEFHESFQKGVTGVYESLNIKKPDSFTIYIAENASDFAKMTGKNWFVASLYVPDSGLFYFQNLSSLYRQSLIEKSIAHELCHQALFVQRASGARPEDFLVTDESFCLAWAPIFEPQGLSTKTRKNLKKWKTYRVFEKKMFRKLQSSSQKRARVFYAIAQDWGAFLLKSLGERKALQVIVHHDVGALEKAYADYIR